MLEKLFALLKQHKSDCAPPLRGAQSLPKTKQPKILEGQELEICPRKRFMFAQALINLRICIATKGDCDHCGQERCKKVAST